MKKTLAELEAAVELETIHFRNTGNGEQFLADAKRKLVNFKRNQTRRNRDQAMRDCGLVRVVGALGGVYWE